LKHVPRRFVRRFHWPTRVSYFSAAGQGRRRHSQTGNAESMAQLTVIKDKLDDPVLPLKRREPQIKAHRLNHDSPLRRSHKRKTIQRIQPFQQMVGDASALPDLEKPPSA
jgi:hypothetical protein